MNEKLKVLPLTPDNWSDLEILFGENGAHGGCWCMWFRQTNAEAERQSGRGNRMAMKQIVDEGHVPGLIAYVDGIPAGWVSVAPRSQFSRLARSRVMKPVDDQPVWSVVCFFIAKPFRKQDLSVELLRAAVNYAQQRGADIVEGYRSTHKRDLFLMLQRIMVQCLLLRKLGLKKSRVVQRDDRLCVSQ